MANKLFKELFVGKYDGVAPPTGLGMGSVVGGQNMRKVSASGGWKARKGCAFHNTTAMAAASVLSLHNFVHPRNADQHFIAQCNGKLWDASNIPPTGGTTFAGSELSSLASASTQGWSDLIGEEWIYADGSGAPVMWGGSSPLCIGFLVYGNTDGSYTDQLRKVRDARSDTYAVVLGGASDKLYICSPLPASLITLDLGANVNSNSVTLTVKDYNGAWASVASMTDGTASGGATLAQDGVISWTPGGDEKKLALGGIMGFWYELSWSGALSGSVYVVACNIYYPPARIVNKWDGVFELPLAVRKYHDVSKNFYDATGSVTNQSTSQYVTLNLETTDYLYIKTVEPIFGVAFGIPDGAASTENAQIDLVEWWDGDSWEDITTVEDGTLDTTGTIGFSQSGIVQWDPAGTSPVRRTFDFDLTPGYWYRISVDAAPSADARVYYMAVLSYPEDLATYKGVVEFKNRAILWGDPEWPNRLRYSAYLRPSSYSGSDSGWTEPFGDASEILVCRRFYNELMVWKAGSVWLLEGYDGRTFGTLKLTDTVGTCAPATCHVVEVGFPDMHKDEALTVAIWMDSDGVYIVDGRKPKKISMPVDHFFNPEYSTCISAANLSNCRAYVDKNNNEYHLLIPDGRELVYNFVTGEWYPPWSRRVGTSNAYLVCGLSLKGSDKRFYTYAGSSEGKVLRLETDTSDKNESNADVAIAHGVKTRAICVDPKTSTVFEFTFRRLKMEAKARSSGSVTVYFYKNLATSPVTLQTPAAPTLIASGEGISTDGVDTSQEKCVAFQVEFYMNTVDVELEIWSFLYEVGATAEIVLG